MRRRRQGASPMFAAGVVVFLIAAIAVVLSLSGDKGVGRQTAPVEITGASLPKDAGAPDAAIGMRAPEARGTDFAGGPVAVANDGRAKAILFLAHWCPHCQREVPVVVDWLKSTGGVQGVDLYTVSTLATSTKPNWPPSSWLERERWTTPVLVDSPDSAVAEAFGLSGTPLWVFVRPDGTVARRMAGEVPVSAFEAEMRALLAPR